MMFNVFIRPENDFSMLMKMDLHKEKFCYNEFFTIKNANLLPELTVGVLK